VWDWTLFIGSIGLFIALMLLFIRFIPMIPAYELRELVHRQRGAAAPDSFNESAPEQRDNTAPPRDVPDDRLHGIAAEFTAPEQLVAAAKRVREKGYTRFDAYTPMPLPNLPGAMGFGWTTMPALVLIGALVGGVVDASAFFFAYLFAFLLWLGIAFILTLADYLTRAAPMIGGVQWAMGLWIRRACDVR